MSKQKEKLAQRVGGRKLVSAEIHPEDIKAIELVVNISKKSNPSLTMKQFVRLAILGATQRALDELERQVKEHEQQAEMDKLQLEGSENGGSTSTEHQAAAGAIEQ